MSGQQLFLTTKWGVILTIVALVSFVSDEGNLFFVCLCEDIKSLLCPTVIFWFLLVFNETEQGRTRRNLFLQFSVEWKNVHAHEYVPPHTHTQIHTHGCIQVILCLLGSVLPRVSMTHTCACCMVLCRYCVETHFPGSFSLISYLILKSSLWLCHAESSFSLAALTSLPV